MELDNTFYAEDLPAWRTWLEANHETSSGVWLIFSKAHTGKQCISYSDSLDEALCFGWIDGLIQRLDDDSYVRRFSPRTNTGNWSPANKVRARKLIEAGRMRPEGLAKLPDAQAMADTTPRARPQLADLPELTDALATDDAARAGWESLPPSHQRNYIGWIKSAVRPETRAKRIVESLGLLRQGKPLSGK